MAAQQPNDKGVIPMTLEPIEGMRLSPMQRPVFEQPNDSELEAIAERLISVGERVQKTKLLDLTPNQGGIPHPDLFRSNAKKAAIKKLQAFNQNQRRKGVRDGYNYALTDVDLATSYDDAYKRVSEGHKRAVERCND